MADIVLTWRASRSDEKGSKRHPRPKKGAEAVERRVVVLENAAPTPRQDRSIRYNADQEAPRITIGEVTSQTDEPASPDGPEWGGVATSGLLWDPRSARHGKSTEMRRLHLETGGTRTHR